LSVVLYECGNLPLTQREERRLRISENRVLGRIFGPKRDEVTGEWSKLHKEELHDLNSSPYWGDQIIKKNEMGEACGTYGGQESRTQGFGGQTSWKETSWKTQA
jgi:hypothetical protein